MKGKQPVWHREAIDARVERALRDLHQLKILDRCHLAEGTGLALHLGHRRSRDLDFFSDEALDPDGIVPLLQPLTGFSVVAKAPGTLHATVEDVKISFLAYAYPLLYPVEKFQDTPVADPRDIACMKLSAIASRATQRDFVDLYVMGKQHGLDEMLRWFQQKYTQANYNRVHVLKSLAYFEDAEKDPMPEMLAPLDWEEVKRFFASEAARLSP
jgi:nucleotidyltransferase AbiEii toxin of type IV toxin-antitoxin system